MATGEKTPRHGGSPVCVRVTGFPLSVVRAAERGKDGLSGPPRPALLPLKRRVATARMGAADRALTGVPAPQAGHGPCLPLRKTGRACCGARDDPSPTPGPPAAPPRGARRPCVTRTPPTARVGGGPTHHVPLPPGACHRTVRFLDSTAHWPTQPPTCDFRSLMSSDHQCSLSYGVNRSVAGAGDLIQWRAQRLVWAAAFVGVAFGGGAGSSRTRSPEGDTFQRCGGQARWGRAPGARRGGCPGFVRQGMNN